MAPHRYLGGMVLLCPAPRRKPDLPRLKTLSLESDAPTTVAATAATGCKTNNAVLYFKGGLTRPKLWRLKMAVGFCWNCGKRTVTSIETPTVEGYIFRQLASSTAEQLCIACESSMT